MDEPPHAFGAQAPETDVELVDRLLEESRDPANCVVADWLHTLCPPAEEEEEERPFTKMSSPAGGMERLRSRMSEVVHRPLSLQIPPARFDHNALVLSPISVITTAGPGIASPLSPVIRIHAPPVPPRPYPAPVRITTPSAPPPAPLHGKVTAALSSWKTSLLSSVNNLLFASSPSSSRGSGTPRGVSPASLSPATITDGGRPRRPSTSSRQSKCLSLVSLTTSDLGGLQWSRPAGIPSPGLVPTSTTWDDSSSPSPVAEGAEEEGLGGSPRDGEPRKRWLSLRRRARMEKRWGGAAGAAAESEKRVTMWN